MKPAFLLFVIVICCTVHPVAAQPPDFKNKPDSVALNKLWNWYTVKLFPMDTTQAVLQIEAAEKIASSCSELVQQQLWLMKKALISEHCSNVPRGANLMLEAAEEAKAKGWELTEAECLQFTGYRYYELARYGPAFEFMLRANNRFREFGYKKYPHLVKYADALGFCYYKCGEYAQAITYCKEIISFEDRENVHAKAAYNRENTIGLAYQRLKQYDSAIIWYKKSYQHAAEAKDTFWAALVNGNTGYVYYLQGNYDAAIPLMKEDYLASKAAGQFGSATNAAMSLAEIFLKRGAVDTAQTYLDFASAEVYKGADMQTLTSWYQSMSKISKLKGEYAKAQLFNDSFLVFKDSLQALANVKIMNQANLKLEMEQHLNEISRLEAQRKQQVFARNILLTLVFFIAILAFVLISRQRLKRNKELQVAKLQQEKAEQELLYAKEQLGSYTSKLREKNELLELFTTEIEQLKQAGVQQSQDRIENLNRLMNATILTEEDWKTFRDLFDKVYPGFFIRLKEKIPDISPAEIRLLSLTKLQLSPKEMAAMLGISYDAIKKNRQRLRKKINLPEEGSWEELAEMI